MIEKLIVRDNTEAPLNYLEKVPAFRNGAEYNFTPGVNVIVGENGCGKTTLLSLLRIYLCVEDVECGRGLFNSSIHRLHEDFLDHNSGFCGGVEVFADYRNNTYNLMSFRDRSSDYTQKSVRNLHESLTASSMSMGQKAGYALETLFNKVFSRDVVSEFDYEGNYGDYPLYMEYIKNHRTQDATKHTLLMDEPDSSMDLGNIMQLYGVLSYNHPDLQVLAVVHNPFLIAKLSGVKDINIIEMSDGYVDKIRKEVDKFNKMK